MPLTFFDIERQKNWRIGLFFLLLVSIYFIVIFLLLLSFFQIFPVLYLAKSGLNVKPAYLLAIFIFSVMLASIHFYFSAYDTVSYIKNNLKAAEPDMEDGIHRRLMNIMDEIHIATGNKKNMKCVIIPTLSMNALSAVDFRGNAIIAITEGMASRLSREQVEAVIAHEAYHILSGDCLESTVASSLFGLPSSAMERAQTISEGRIFFSPAYILAFILIKLSILLNFFISREREYRADAGAVHMMRNPLALAEVLHLLSKNWRGAGYIGRGLEMLCIVNPQASQLDESESFFADLMSTHPPINKRIEILLKMARVCIAELDSRLNNKMQTAQTASESGFYALDPRHQWQGPYTIADLASVSWFSPLTWVSSGTEKAIERAWRQPSMYSLLNERLLREENETSDILCPHCNQPLIKISYEKTKVHQCRFCGGILIDNDKINRVIARREKDCSGRIKSIAKAAIMDNQKKLAINKLRGSRIKIKSVISCPKCKNPMFRTFYSLAYLIEIDRCSTCNITWFDTDELDMLQCLIENRITPMVNIYIHED